MTSSDRMPTALLNPCRRTQRSGKNAVREGKDRRDMLSDRICIIIAGRGDFWDFFQICRIQKVRQDDEIDVNETAKTMVGAQCLRCLYGTCPKFLLRPHQTTCTGGLDGQVDSMLIAMGMKEPVRP